MVAEMTLRNSTKLDLALQYAKLGFAVFPAHYMKNGICSCGSPNCRNKAKHPMTGRDLLDATTSERTIRGWWEDRWPLANIAIATGEASGLLVLDVDGKKGRATLAAKGWEIPKTPSVSTGRENGGVHYYFKHPGGKFKNSANKLGEKVDIRAEGGYVIAPGSIHATGNPYLWVVAPRDLPGEFAEQAGFADVPDWLLKELESSDERKAPLPSLPLLKDGGRNTRLTQEAGIYLRLGYSPKAMEGALKARNQFDTEEPLSDEEVETIARSIGAKTPGDLLLEGGHTEAAYAARLALHQGHEIRYVDQWNRWITWNGARWVVDESKGAEMQGRAKAMLTASYLAANSITNNNPDLQKAMQDDFREAVRGKETKRAIDAIIDLTRSEPDIMVNPGTFDVKPYLLNLANGMLDLRTFSFGDGEKIEPLEHDPVTMVTKIAPVAFDSQATCPTWERFISEVFQGNQELIRYVQRTLGYALSGDTSEHSFWIAYGSGANGKSTLLNTIQAVMGDYAATTAFTTFDADNRNQYGNDIAALMGRRFVAALEADSERKLSEARIKSVSAGDPFTCKFLYGEYFTFVPQFKTWLAVNHKPIIRGQDRGIWRRLKLIPFEVNFEGKADKQLPEKLKEELPGILNWLLRGFIDWRDNGMQEPEIVRKATEEYREESDQLGQWISARCDLGESEPVLTSDLYANYKDWLQSNGDDRYPMSSTRFGRELGDRPDIRKYKETKGGQPGKHGLHGDCPSGRNHGAEANGGEIVSQANVEGEGLPPFFEKPLWKISYRTF